MRVTVMADYANLDIIPVSPIRRQRFFLSLTMRIAKAILALLLGVHFCRAEMKKPSSDSSEEKSNRWDETYRENLP